MSSLVLLLVGVAVASFVGFNVGGSNTGVAFGPAVGSGAVSKLGAAGLMSVSFLIGGWTLGRRVVDTLGQGLVAGDPFTMEVSIAASCSSGWRCSPATCSGCPPRPR